MHQLDKHTNLLMKVVSLILIHICMAHQEFFSSNMNIKSEYQHCQQLYQHTLLDF